MKAIQCLGKNIFFIFFLSLSTIGFSQNETYESTYEGKIYLEKIFTDNPQSRNEIIQQLENIKASPILVLVTTIKADNNYTIIDIKVDQEKSAYQLDDSQTIVIDKHKQLVYDFKAKRYFKLPKIKMNNKDDYSEIIDSNGEISYIFLNEELNNLISPTFLGKDIKYGVELLVQKKSYSLLENTTKLTTKLDYKKIFDGIDPKDIKNTFKFF